MKRIAIIPARSGSKRIIDKNIKSFCGKPIIAYTLEAVKNSNLFDVIHVSTDSKKIADLVISLGYSVDFLRPAKLSDDYTPIMPVLKWVLQEFRERGIIFDEVATIMPCAPFIESSDLISASKLLEDNQCRNPILAVAPYSAPIEWAFNIEDDSILNPVQPGMFSKRSQDLPSHYYDTGSFAFFSYDFVINSEGAGSDDFYRGQIIEKYKAIDIDDVEDWNYAEKLFHGIHSV
jgi:pseudaminic acid cytidylyltransferase